MTTHSFQRWRCSILTLVVCNDDGSLAQMEACLSGTAARGIMHDMQVKSGPSRALRGRSALTLPNHALPRPSAD